MTKNTISPPPLAGDVDAAKPRREGASPQTQSLRRSRLPVAAPQAREGERNRRAFVTLLAGAAASAAWPLSARAQQPTMPVIGYLSSLSPEDPPADALAAFLKGLGETGYVEGRNVAIEYRWARGITDRLPELVADLVRRRVDVIAAPGNPPATLAARAATTTIPIVFSGALDPVANGFVASLNRPGGNITGVTTLGAELGPKRLEVLHELLPAARLFAVLVNPTGSNAESFVRNVQAGARTLGLEIEVVGAGNERDLEGVFATLARLRAGGLLIAPDQILYAFNEQIAALALRHAVPTIFQYRRSVVAGGLMSYGGDGTDAWRLVGAYVGRILKGEKPADLPVHQSTRVELVINMKTARALGLTFPITLLGRADEVIE